MEVPFSQLVGSTWGQEGSPTVVAREGRGLTVRIVQKRHAFAALFSNKQLWGVRWGVRRQAAEEACSRQREAAFGWPDRTVAGGGTGGMWLSRLRIYGPCYGLIFGGPTAAVQYYRVTTTGGRK